MLQHGEAVPCLQLSSSQEHLSCAWMFWAAQGFSPASSFITCFCPSTSVMGLYISSIFAWGQGDKEPMQSSQTHRKPVLETGMSHRPLGCACKTQPAGNRLFLYPIVKNFQERLYNIKFLLLQNTQIPSFFPASRTEKKG